MLDHMASVDCLDILPQIQALVSDQLQVVSYKWLSRNFSIPSNRAKRLLQEFVESHGDGLEALYTVCGWAKKNPQAYCVRLASASTLGGVKQEFEDNCSVQIYSVQACIPKDLALLWSTEFVQAEELFNQPSNADNCLRDNRFCGVFNAFVKREVVEGNVGSIFPQSKSGVGVNKMNAGAVPATSPFQGQIAELSAKKGIQTSEAGSLADKSDKTAPESVDKTNKQNDLKETKVGTTSKRKGLMEKVSSGTGGSLSNLWGRASAKSKLTSSASDANDVRRDVAVSAEAQISSREAADDASSDDDEAAISYKRESDRGSNRKRKAIIGLSDDDDDDENAVSLASPDRSYGNPTVSFVDEKDMEVDAKPAEVNQEKNIEQDSRILSENILKSGSIYNNSHLQEKTCDGVLREVGDQKHKNDPFTSAKSGMRKVMRTRIDERGREVREVVWEGEAAGNNVAEKILSTNGTGNRPPVANNAPTTDNHTASDAVAKAANKKASKGGTKDSKQGNIMSFFKKI